MIEINIVVQGDKIHYRFDARDASIEEASLAIAHMELSKKYLLELLEEDGECEAEKPTATQEKRLFFSPLLLRVNKWFFRLKHLGRN